jgi:hypothetical protein
MTQTTFKVSREFLVAGHKDACSAWKKTLEEKFPEAFQAPTEAPTFKIGDRFKGIGTDGSREFMLAQVDASIINLINLANGNRWTHTVVEVDDVTHVTTAELKQLIGNTSEVEVNGRTVSLKPVAKRVRQSFDVDIAFIQQAARAASSEWANKIKAEFPKAFERGYLKLTNDGGHSMRFTISDVATAIQPTSGIDAQICIAKGYVQGSVNRPDLSERALCIEGDDVERVEVIHEPTRGRWFIAIKIKES